MKITMHTLKNLGKLKTKLLALAVVALLGALNFQIATALAGCTLINGSFIKAANLPWLDGAEGHDIGYGPDGACDYSHADMDAALGNMQQMGITVVRLWINEDQQGLVLDGSGHVTGLDTITFLPHLDDIISLAKTHNIAIYLCLVDFWDAPWAFPTQNNYLQNAVVPLVTHYKGNPNIFAIDLMNEIDGTVEPTSELGCGCEDWFQAQAYVKTAALAIHTADPTRLVSCSVGWVPAWGTIGQELTGLGLDFYDFHDYEDMPSFPPVASLGLDKPVFIGECGQSTTNLEDTLQSTCELDFLNRACAEGYAGTEIWAYGETVYDGVNYLSMLNVDTDGSERPVCTTIHNWNGVPPPVICSVSPANGQLGTTVTITGDNLNGATVSFNGTAATPVSDTEGTITFAVPAGTPAGTYTVSVTIGGQTVTATVTLPNYPYITSFTPTSEAMGTTVIITGGNFTENGTVYFNGQLASFTFNSASTITATVPCPASSGPISVTTPVGTGMSEASFTVPLWIDFKSQASPLPIYFSYGNPCNLVWANVEKWLSMALNGCQGCVTTSPPPGWTNSITPAGLTVTFNGIPGALVTNATGQVSVVVPVTYTNGPIVCYAPTNVVNLPANFVFQYAFSSVAPASGAPGATVVITDTNLTGVTAVAFNGVPATFVSNAFNRITATLPAGATSGPITVTTPDWTLSSTLNFTVLPPVTNLVIYGDSLVNGFQDYSWATVNGSSTNPVYSGSYAISVFAQQYQALWPYHAPFNSAPYASLSFAINGGPAGAAGVKVVGVVNAGIAAAYNLPTLPTNRWTQFNIPLSALGVANITNCEGFWFYATNPGTTTFDVDAIQLNTGTTPLLAPVSTKPKSGSFVLQLSGITGQTYWIETSTNLVNWMTVSTNTLTSASLEVTNAVSPYSNRQFWRAVLPQ